MIKNDQKKTKNDQKKTKNEKKSQKYNILLMLIMLLLTGFSIGPIMSRGRFLSLHYYLLIII